MKHRKFAKFRNDSRKMAWLLDAMSSRRRSLAAEEEDEEAPLMGRGRAALGALGAGPRDQLGLPGQPPPPPKGRRRLEGRRG